MGGMAPDPTALLERAENQEAIERRLTQVLEGPSAAQTAITLVAALVTTVSGAYLTGTLATAPLLPEPPVVGVFVGQVMLATGTLLVGVTLARVDARARERRVLRALRDLLGASREA